MVGAHNLAGLYLRKFAAFYGGCVSCYLLQVDVRVSAVVASATVGLTATFLPLPARYDRPGLQAAIFAGSFAGMGSPDLLKGYASMLVVSLFGALLFIAVRPRWEGFGGKFGLVALVASLLMLVVLHFKR